MLKKAFALVLCLALSGSLLAACGSSAKTPEAQAPASSEASAPAPSTPEEAQLSGNIIWCCHRTDFQTTLLPQYIEEFNKTYPDIKVSIETYKDYKETVRIKMSSNDMPDVLDFAFGDYTNDQVIANFMHLDSVSYAGKFDPSVNKQFTATDGKLYGFSTGISASMAIYIKKIFSSLNLAVPQTLDDFIKVAKAITDSGKVGLASASKAKWPFQNYWFDLPFSTTGDVNAMNNAATVDEPFTKDSGLYKSFYVLKQLADAKVFEKDPLSADWEPMKKEFQSGNVGMFYLGNWFVPQAIGTDVTEADVGVFPFPYDNNPGPHNVVAASDYGWGMGKGSKNADAQAAFFDFLNDTKYADWAKQTGLLSARTDITVDSAFTAEFESYKPVKLFGPANTKELDDCISKSQLDWGAMGQQILGGKDIDAIFSDLNAKWKKARGN
jgi:raffinose/stachyose/melibiose transport system substrate-binding protein